MLIFHKSKILSYVNYLVLLNFPFCKNLLIFFNPLTSPGDGLTVFTYPYLSAGAPASGEAKWLMSISKIMSEYI